MRMAVLVWAGGWMLLLQGCSGESLERVGYETMRNVKEQQCLNREMRQCPENLSYDEYQGQRRELDAAEKDGQ